MEESSGGMIRKSHGRVMLAVALASLFGCAGVPTIPVSSFELDLRSAPIPVMLNSNLIQPASEHGLYAQCTEGSSESNLFWILWLVFRQSNAPTQTTTTTATSALSAGEQLQRQIARSDAYLVVTDMFLRTHSLGLWPFYGEASMRLDVAASAHK